MSAVAAETETSPNRLYVGNLDYKIKTEDLALHFKTIPGFVSAEVSSSSNGRSRGYGLVEFSSAAAASDAIESLNESTLGERKVFIRLDRGANSKPESDEKRGAGRQPADGGERRGNANKSNIAPLRVRPEDEGRLLYVGNIPWRSSWQDIKDHFREVGSVIRVDIPMNKATRRSRGFATVLFEKKEDAVAAIEKLNNTDMNGRTITVRLDQYVAKQE